MSNNIGRSKATLKTCDNGHYVIKCRVKTRKGSYCKSRPRLCGYCYRHCEENKEVGIDMKRLHNANFKVTNKVITRIKE